MVHADTVDIVDIRGRLRIRLLGIDTPESPATPSAAGVWRQASSRNRPCLGNESPSSPIRARACTNASAGLGLLGQGRRLGLLGRSGARAGAAHSYVYHGHPSARRDCSCRTGSDGRWPGPVGTAVLRPNDVSPNLIRRGAPPPNGLAVRGARRSVGPANFRDGDVVALEFTGVAGGWCPFMVGGVPGELAASTSKAAAR